jgi:hypothetical protein
MYAWLMDLISKMAGKTAKKNMERESESVELVSTWGKIKYWAIHIFAYVGTFFFLAWFGIVAISAAETDPIPLLLAIIVVVGPMVYFALKMSDKDE